MSKVLAVYMTSHSLSLVDLSEGGWKRVEGVRETSERSFVLAKSLKVRESEDTLKRGSLTLRSSIIEIAAGAKIEVVGYSGAGVRYKEYLEPHESELDIRRHYGKGAVVVSVEGTRFSLDSWVYVYRQLCTDFDCDQIHVCTAYGDQLIYVE